MKNTFFKRTLKSFQLFSMEKEKKSPTKKPKFVWANLSNTHYMSVRQCIEEMGYRITDSEYKNMILWCDASGSIETASCLQPWQFYNHFPGILSIARKVELARNYERMYRALPQIMNFHPKSFLLPGQFSDLKTYMLSIPKKTDRTFIIKPDRGSQGRGIILVQDPEDLDEYCEMSVAQQYIDPYLIDGYKFDLRIYALLTSVDPLRIYIYQEGMARFCTEPYVPPKSSNLEQVYSHLTNYSLNKKNDHFQQPENADEADCGSKRSLTSVYKYITKNGGDVSAIQHEIESIIRKTIGSIQPLLSNSYHTAINHKDEKSRCFEILGFDILLDSSLKPWLLEVNCMPSLSCDSPFDTQLKFGVIKGTLKILDLNPNFKKRILARQKAITQVRISGSTKLKVPELFDPKVETEISKTTLWKQIYPFETEETQTTDETKKTSQKVKRSSKTKKPENEIEEDEEDILDQEKLNSDSYVMELLLAKAREYPVCAAIETNASRARKEAALQHIKQYEQDQNQNCPLGSTKSSSTTKKKKNNNGNRQQLNNQEPKKKLKPLPRVAGLSTKPKQISRNPSSASNYSTNTSASTNANQDSKFSMIINEFSSLPVQNIDEFEERERIKFIKKQAFLASSTNLLQNIKSLLQEQNILNVQQQMKLQEQKINQQKLKQQQQFQQQNDSCNSKFSPGSGMIKFTQNPFNSQQQSLNNGAMPQIQIHQIQINPNQQQGRARNLSYYNIYSQQQKKKIVFPPQQQQTSK